MSLSPRRPHALADEQGYLMVALLVAIAVMGIALSVALPSWRTWAQREKEAELIFRGEQYARAIALYQRKYGNASPPNVDVLVTEKFLRKKYKDPVTGEDFQTVVAGAAIPGQQQPGGAGQRAGGPGTGLTPSGPRGAQPSLGLAIQQQRQQQQQQQRQQQGRGAAPQAGQPGPGAVRGGIVGVVSKSEDKAFRLYNGRDAYNLWVFMGTEMSQRAGLTQNPAAAGLPPGSTGPGLGPDAQGRGGRGMGGRGLDLGGRGRQQGPARGGENPAGRGSTPTGPGRGFGGRLFEK